MGYTCTVFAISLPKFSPYSNHLSSNSKNYRSLPSSLGPRRISIRNPNSLKLPFVVFAEEEGKNNNRGVPPEEQQEGDVKGGERQRPPPALNLRWRDVLYPDPENIVAIGLMGLLTWVSVQVLGQLFFISVAILLAALKYSFIAALLLFILITLL